VPLYKLSLPDIFFEFIILINYKQQDFFFEKITVAKRVKKFVALYEINILCPISIYSPLLLFPALLDFS